MKKLNVYILIIIIAALSGGALGNTKRNKSPSLDDFPVTGYSEAEAKYSESSEKIAGALSETVETHAENSTKDYTDNAFGTYAQMGGGISTEKTALLDAEFSKLVEKFKDFPGEYGLYVKDLATETTYEYQAKEIFYGASLYKIPVAVAVLKEIDAGNLTYEYKFEYKNVDVASGTGTIIYDALNSRYTVRELLEKLLKDSDNVAQNILIRNIGKSKVIALDPNLFDAGNHTTPYKLAVFLESLSEGKVLKRDTIAELMEIMSETAFDDRIYPGLSKHLTFSHKIGNWGESGSWHDCGIVAGGSQRVVVCLMSKNTSFEDFVSVAKNTGNFVSLMF